jgi:hypothetical protein
MQRPAPFRVWRGCSPRQRPSRLDHLQERCCRRSRHRRSSFDSRPRSRASRQGMTRWPSRRHYRPGHPPARGFSPVRRLAGSALHRSGRPWQDLERRRSSRCAHPSSPASPQPTRCSRSPPRAPPRREAADPPIDPAWVWSCSGPRARPSHGVRGHVNRTPVDLSGSRPGLRDGPRLGLRPCSASSRAGSRRGR